MARSLRPIEVFPITTRRLEVLRVADVTTGMRRVTLGGEQLKAHTAENGFPVAAFRSDGFDDEFKILLKHPDAAEAVVPAQADGVLNWPREDPHLLLRTYTVRRWDPVAGELDVDFVKHGVGPATSWAYRVQPGEGVQVAGPKSSSPHPEGADWTLVAGDETALPAIGRWLEEWPAGARGQVFVETAEREHWQDLPVPDGVELTWLSRDGAEPGTTTLLYDAITGADWWEGTVFAWVAGETLTLTPIRRWLRGEKGLGKEQVEVTGYWRRQEVAVSEDDASLPDFDAVEDDDEAFHELSELAPGFALRVAATIGLADALAGGAGTVAEVAEATRSDAVGVGKLLRYLAALGVAERDGDRWGLTPLGRGLEDDYLTASLDLAGVAGRRELGGLLSLLSAVRTGRGDHAAWFGEGYEESVLGDEALAVQRVEDDAEDAVYVAGALAGAAPFSAARSAVVAGRGAGAIARALVAAHAGLSATVVAAPSELSAHERLHGAHERVSLAAASVLDVRSSPADVVLLAGVLGSHPDEDAVHVLRQASASLTPGGRVLVFGEVLDEALAHEHDYEHDLIGFALTGGGERTHAEHLALFGAAGLARAERLTVGWGFTLYVLAPEA